MLKLESDLKAAGMESCAIRYRDQLLKAQRIAVELARIHGTVTSDDVREEAQRRGLCLSFGKNWVGSIFKGKGWIKLGYVQSRHAGGHGRVIAQWKLAGESDSSKIHPLIEAAAAVCLNEAFKACGGPIKNPVFATELFELPKTISDEFLQ